MSAKSRKESLSAHLMQSILTQALLPGTELDEAGLCAAFELSRTPVREVFGDLEGLGFVQSREKGGYRVSDLSHRTLRDFFHAAPMIYGAILLLAARNGSARQLGDLKDAQSEFRAALRSADTPARTLANHRFHHITGAMAGNIYLLPSFERLLIDHARIGMTFFHTDSAAKADTLSRAAAQHDAMITAIEERDETAAAALAEDHWALSRSEIESFVTPASLDIPLGGTRKGA